MVEGNVKVKIGLHGGEAVQRLMEACLKGGSVALVLRSEFVATH
jgi:hypothetical protein